MTPYGVMSLCYLLWREWGEKGKGALWPSNIQGLFCSRLTRRGGLEDDARRSRFVALDEASARKVGGSYWAGRGRCVAFDEDSGLKGGCSFFL